MDSVEELLGVDLLFVFKRAQQVKVACHDTALDGVDSSFLELIGKVDQLRQLVELAALSQCARPREDGSDGVRRGLFAL